MNHAECSNKLFFQLVWIPVLENQGFPSKLLNLTVHECVVFIGRTGYSQKSKFGMHNIMVLKFTKNT